MTLSPSPPFKETTGNLSSPLKQFGNYVTNNLHWCLILFILVLHNSNCNDKKELT